MLFRSQAPTSVYDATPRSRYQSTVRRRPSSMLVVARHPEIARARQPRTQAPRESLEYANSLTLQLRSAFDVGLTCCSLVGAPPQRPGDHVSGPDAALGQAHRHAPDLLDRPADQRAMGLALVFIFGGVNWLARWRTTTIMAKASITSETCRCQPCQERVSL